MTEAAHVTDSLSREQAILINTILRNTPIEALPHNGSRPRVATFTDVVVNLESIVSFLRHQMSLVETLEAEHNRVDADLRAAGRILGRMGIGQRQT